MSYGFSMAFTPCNSFERALMIGAQCSDLLRKPENTKHLINDNLIFLPSLRYHDDVNPFSDGNWLHRFFTMRFVYWDSQKILGLVIDNPEANGLGEFFDHSIYFQNSTDQDYDIDVWPTSCPWFSEIVANHSSITVQGLLKKERWNGTTAKDMEENFLYYVRSDIYGDDVFGSQYAFLSKEEATAWLNANYPGAILVDRTQEVTGVLSFGDVQPDKFITIPCSIDRFADLFAGCLSTTSINVNGVFAIYDTSTQNDPFAENRFVARMGDDGTPAESVCGAYLLLRTKVNADGSRSLCSIDQPEQEIVADTVKEPSPAAQLFL